MRNAASAAAALAATAVLSAQQPVFRAGVELVTIDVVATGSDGAPLQPGSDDALAESTPSIETFGQRRERPRQLSRAAGRRRTAAPDSRPPQSHDGLLLHDQCFAQFTSQ